MIKLEEEALSIYKSELNRYQQQLKALQNDKSYSQFEEKRTQLANFYEENITRLRERIESIESKNSSPKNETIQRNKTSKTDS